MKKKLIIASIITLIFIVIIIHHHKKNNPNNTSNTLSSIPVRVEKPIQQSLSQTANATGYLIAKKSTTITPRTSGYIQLIYPHEGQTVTAGQILFQLDNQAEKNALAAAQATYELSQLQYNRNKKFLQKGYITQDMYYASEVTFKQNQAALETAETNLANRSITAPFDGTMGALSASLGDYVNPGTALTRLVDNKHLRVEYALPVKDLSQLQLNQSVTISDESNNNKINATVTYISPAIDQNTQTIAVHATIDNQAQIFKPGEYVTIMQNLGPQKNALLVPEQSVLASINGYHVFIVKDNKAIKVPVKMGDRMNGNVVITAGLSPNDPVIIAGENEVKNNQVVSIH
ncbi:MAG: hypothetical protein A3F13_04765 [Gammaproteobacteria bacterium RIFCSPHIGHO2_12_FULL_40_19]|nr:MAG: hypothetical protein A3F13_04765 [Gammaproteobacteria bacterium RIFCSPHIGHO2_12_FULL_40_19]